LRQAVFGVKGEGCPRREVRPSIAGGVAVTVMGEAIIVALVVPVVGDSGAPERIVWLYSVVRVRQSQEAAAAARYRHLEVRVVAELTAKVYRVAVVVRPAPITD